MQDPNTSKNLVTTKIASFLSFTMCTACILWNINLPTKLGFAILTEQYMAFQLGLAITIAFLMFDYKGQKKKEINLIDLILAFVGFSILLWATFSFPQLLLNQAYHPVGITIIGAVVVILTLEGIRRKVGLTLFIIVSIFLSYSLFANKVPGVLVGEGLSLKRLVEYVGFDPSAVFSMPLEVGTIIIILFVLFGRLLFAAGGGEFLIDLAIASIGRARGTSAKISIFASAFFGSISGSAVSNVVTTGVITIPLMQKEGYSKSDSAAIEAIASTGGQLTPPIMGTAAFLMAEFLDISYTAVAIAAIIPAILYYLSILTQATLIANRDDTQTIDDNNLSINDVLKGGWHFILTFAILLISLFYFNYTPEESSLLASLFMGITGFFRGYKGNKLSILKLKNVFVQTGISMVDLILIVASAGFVIGILNITGLGFALTLLLVDSTSNNFALILLVSAFVCIFLGMGMPTSGVYVLLATLVAPSLVEIGIVPIAAHMFILYFGLMSMITPPVALATFAASNIANSNALNTALTSLKISWVAFVIPFVFVSNPNLLMAGSRYEILEDFTKTVIGLISICIGSVGYFRNKITFSWRVFFITLGLGCFPVGFIQNQYWQNINILICIVTVILIVSIFTTQKRRIINEN